MISTEIYKCIFLFDLKNKIQFAKQICLTKKKLEQESLIALSSVLKN
jgi:hypothetical protein